MKTIILLITALLSLLSCTGGIVIPDAVNTQAASTSYRATIGMNTLSSPTFISSNSYRSSAAPVNSNMPTPVDSDNFSIIDSLLENVLR